MGAGIAPLGEDPQILLQLRLISQWPDGQPQVVKIQLQYLRPHVKLITLPETNMAPENNPLEKEIPIGNHQF